MKRLGHAWLWALAGCGNADLPPAVEDPATLPISALMDPQTCRECHPKHYEEWSGSMHAYATDDPLFVAINARGIADARIGPFCVKCHAPMAVRTGMTKNGTILSDAPELRGVTCYFCHNVDGVIGTRNNTLLLADDAVMRGGYADAVPNPAHRSAYSPYDDRSRPESALMCGACHDVVNRFDKRIERTFEDWQGTAFAQEGLGTTCGGCHMKRTEGPIAEGPRVTGVVPRTFHGHRFAAVDRALLDRPDAEAQERDVREFLGTALRTALCVRGDVLGPSLMLVVQNAAGHGWPSGAAQHRRLWFEIAAYNKAGEVMYRSGAVPPGESPVTLDDPDLWLLRDCFFDRSGQPTHAMWDAVSVESNQLPGLLTFDPAHPDYAKARVWRRFPRELGRLSDYPDRVTMRVRLQPFPLELFDDLYANPADQGTTPEEARAMRAKLAAPLDVGDELEWTLHAADDPATGGQTYIDAAGAAVRCVSKTGLDAAADKVPAAERATCKP